MNAEHALVGELGRGFAEAMPLIVWIAGPDGRPDHFNSRWSEYTGLSREAGLGDGWFDAMHPLDRARRAEDWRAAVERGEAREFECRLRRADGAHRRHRVRVAPVRDDRGGIVRWVGSMIDVDVDDHHREAEAWRRDDDELERFALVAAHDLQEPLRKIQAFGDRLETKHAAALDGQGREYLRRIVAAAARMRDMVGDALALARVATEDRPFVTVDLRAVAEEVVLDLELLIHQTRGRVELGPLPTIQADPIQMRRLLQNLIVNALKFHRPGTAPQVKVSAREIQADADADADGEPEPVAVELAVADDGVGFDEVNRERIFQPFQRLRGRSEHGGTGLGLAICRRIVDRHSGALTASSEPGKGSVFRVTLPIRHPDRDVEARGGGPAGKRDGEPRNE